MEVLVVLEKKVVLLVELVNKLQLEAVQLTQERAKLRDQLDALENSLLARDQHAEERSKELAATKNAVDDMIRSIDLLLERELARMGSHEAAQRESQ